MNAVVSVPFTTPDGVERQLRSTLGAKKRICDLLGMHAHDALNKYDSGAFPYILFALLHDANGNPPEGITVSYLAENLLPENTVEILAAIYSALSNGQVEKKALEPVIQKRLTELLTGLHSGASVLNPSDSPTDNSGGDTSNAKSTPELSDTPNPNGDKITEPVS